MRLSRLLKLSFVGSLLFSPTMAQEASKVHEDALKVLRSGSADTNRTTTAPAAPLGRETRAERDARLRMEAQQRLAERERIQAEKRRQFEEYVKERERLRSGAPAGTVQDQAVKVLREQSNPGATPAPAAVATPPPAAAAPAPVVQPQPTPAPAAPAVQATPPQSANDDVQQRALEIIRQQREQPAAAAPVRESEVAPRTIATPAPRTNAEDTHQKALEVLRQQQSQPSTATAAQPAAPREDDLKPSPELQKRLDEMHRELNTPPPRSAQPVNTQADADYTRELEQRALQSLQQRSAPASAPAAPATAVTRTAPAAPAKAQPAIDNNTREMLRRQDEQLRRQSSGVAATPTPRATPAPALSNTIDPAAEQRAREILRQQQQAVSNGSTATSAPERAAQPQQPAPVRSTPAPAPAVAATPAATPTPAPAPASVSTPSAPNDYSRELEERARQSILARSQEQDPAAAQAQAQAQAAATAAADPLKAPVTPNPELDRVHSRAYETLVQVQPGESGKVQFKSKQERLRALTDLYKADRMTPAEYHQRRAAILAEKEQP